jgi:hypothetical protein
VIPRAVLLVVVVLGAVACATPVVGSPAPSSTPPTLAPPVPEPRDARGISPCELLTPGQLEELDVDPTTRITDLPGAGPRCQWRTRDGTGVLTVSNGADLPAGGFVGGLEGLYLLRETYRFFEPGEIDGFPVVRADSGIGDATCTINIGVADDQLLVVAVGRAFTDEPPCDTARQVASMVLSNLPPRN